MTPATISLINRLLRTEMQRLAWNANLADKGSKAGWAINAARRREACRKAMQELNQQKRPA